MAPPTVPSWEDISALMSFERKGTIQQLYRALFTIRQQAPSQEEAVAMMARGLGYTELLGSVQKANSSAVGVPGVSGSESVLFRHECCYLLGQVGADTKDLDLKKKIFEVLLGVLVNLKEDEVTRHEAAEGIAAVFNHNVEEESAQTIRMYFEHIEQEVDNMLKKEASPDNVVQSQDRHRSTFIPESDGQGTADKGFAIRNASLVRILERFSDTNTPLGQTCFLALEGLRRHTAKVCACQYNSYDPAIGDPHATAADIPKWSAILIDPNADFFQRYIAMFTLRNLDATRELVHALDVDTSSPVLRHEISFILGQMESDDARDALIRNLENPSDHPMVRHESAIALGSVGGEAAKVALRQHSRDHEPMVADSCLVALDTIAYWEAWDEEEKRIMEGLS